MEVIYFEKPGRLKKNLSELEKKLKVKITVEGKKAILEGEAIDEYEARIIMEAISMGFSAKQALTLQNPDMRFLRIPIKSFTRRKDMEVVRGRIIGTQGKTKRTIESVSDCNIIINDNEVGVIGDAEELEEAKTAITNLIRGTKEANVYRFLERMNAGKKNLNPNLDLKPFAKKENSKKDKEN